MAVALAFRSEVHPARPAGLSLRPLRAEDLSFLSDLYALVRQAELAPVPWTDEAKRQFLQHQFDLQRAYYEANYPGADFLVMEENGTRVGRIYVYRTPGDIRLMDIALLPTHRGRGIGSGLLEELIDESERTGASITLHVEEDNPAMAWYRRLGFEHLEDRGVYQYMGRFPANHARRTPISASD